MTKTKKSLKMFASRSLECNCIMSMIALCSPRQRRMQFTTKRGNTLQLKFLFSLTIQISFNNRPIPKGIKMKQLTPDIIPRIAPIYPLRNEDTHALFERLIKYNFSMGAFSEDTGELLAFNLQFMSGEVMAMQVDPKHKRRKLASILAESMGKLITRNGIDIFVRCAIENTPALKLSESLGMTRVGQMCHIVVGPKNEKIKNKL